jgi:hypothetical protein
MDQCLVGTSLVPVSRQLLVHQPLVRVDSLSTTFLSLIITTMSRSGPGPETEPEPDQHSRPRRTSTTRIFFDPSPSASAAGRSRQPISSSSTHTHNNINSHYHPKVGSSHSSLEPNPGSLQNISESESEDDEGDEMRELSKLELRRAKNRLKQRNLRRKSFSPFSLANFIIRS